MNDVLKLICTLAVIGIVIYPIIKVLMASAIKAGERKKPGLAFFLLCMQFTVFLGGFTLMLFFALVFMSKHTTLF